MKRLCLIVAGLVVLSVMAIGCEPSAHSRYRDLTYRRAVDTDVLGFQDDFDSTVLLSDRPNHLSEWYNN
jgi:hypothetical protein